MASSPPGSSTAITSTPSYTRPRATWAGQWHYSADVSEASPTAVYDGLCTNLPCDVMQLSDFPFPPGTAQYPHRSVVQRYLEDFADGFDLRRFIAFHASVQCVDRAPDGGFDVTVAHSTAGGGRGRADGDARALRRGLRVQRAFQCSLLSAGAWPRPAILRC